MKIALPAINGVESLNVGVVVGILRFAQKGVIGVVVVVVENALAVKLRFFLPAAQFSVNILII